MGGEMGWDGIESIGYMILDKVYIYMRNQKSKFRFLRHHSIRFRIRF